MPDNEMPEGFLDLVRLAMKDRPEKLKSTGELWDKFLFIVFMGGKRSEAEINLVLSILKPQLGMDYVRKTSGEDWREAVEKILDERMYRIRDKETLEMLRELKKEMFRISASIKGSARFFEKNGITPETLEKTLGTKEKTWEFIEGLVKDADVPNIRYTKIIFWLHSVGFGYDFCPPSWQTKKFVNEDIGPYYQFYEDDAYFMKQAEGFAEGVKKKAKGATARDVSAAIYYYITLKSMLPPRSPQKKKFTPAKLLKFLKVKKLSLKTLAEKLAGAEEKEELAEKLHEWAGER
ncbi:MAG: hypothetical protein HYW26_04540 [Candidatus Aenigmarchaeota archaeon]|nr:hypothetical protein [Candidatus Aenigmarchaeota archaeon]